MSYPLTMSILTKLQSLLGEGWHIEEDNKLHRAKVVPAQDTPWVYHNVDFMCVKWHQMFFDLVTDKTMVHSHCQWCYKIVVIPRTLAEVVVIEAYQEETTEKNKDIRCKVGMDLRPYTAANWGAYWYTRSLEEAQERYAEIHKFLTDCWEDDAPDHYIKLACTEFERALGPSTEYHVSEQQWALEKKLDDALDFDPFESLAQPPLIVEKVHEAWINWAHSHGDMTYLNLTNGVPLERPAVRYPTGMEEDNGEER